MSLLKAVTKAEECLKGLAEWIKVSFHCDPLGNIDRRPYQDQPAIGRQMNEIVCDAIALLRNCGQAVRLSALHTYYSALPLTPKTRELFKCYSGKTFSIPDVICSRPLWESESVRILEGHTSAVNHVIFSPDGKKLASASDDHTLRLWDVENGQPIGHALKGHPQAIHHVVFSPDGKKLASASSDNTLRLWDVENGQPIGDALKGHTGRSATLFSHQTERSLRRHRRTARCGSGTSTTVNPLAMHSKVTPMGSTTLFSHQTERSLHRHQGSQHVATLGRRERSTHRRCTQRSHPSDPPCRFFTRRKEACIGIVGQHVATLGRRERSTHRPCTQRSHPSGQPCCFFTRRKEACVGIVGQHVAALGRRQPSTHWRCTPRSRRVGSATLFSHQTERSLHRHHGTARCGSGTSTTVNPLAMHSKVTPVRSATLFSHQTERSLHQHHATTRCGSGTSRAVNPSAMHSEVTPMWSTKLSFHQLETSLHRYPGTARCGSGMSRTVTSRVMHSKVRSYQSIALFFHQTEGNLHQHRMTRPCASGTSAAANPSAIHLKFTPPLKFHRIKTPLHWHPMNLHLHSPMNHGLQPSLSTLIKKVSSDIPQHDYYGCLFPYVASSMCISRPLSLEAVLVL